MSALPQSLLQAVSFRPRSLKFPNAWVGHVPFAAWLITEFAPKVFVELGTQSGNSYFSFCQAIADARLPTRCYAVDTWKGDEHSGEYGEEVFAEVSRYHNEHYATFSRLVRARFDEAVQSFEDGGVDLLHIDGLHTYEAVRHDFETWLCKLSPGALVLFHDTNVREHNFGVWKLWFELRQAYPNNLEFTHSHGLGVLQLNNAPTERQRQWLVPGSKDQETVIRFFTAMSTWLLDRSDLGELRSEAARLHQVIGELNAAVADRDARLVAQIAERDAQSGDWDAQIAERDARIARVSSELQSSRNAAKAHVEQLRQECERLKQQCLDDRAAAQQLQARLAEIERGMAWPLLVRYRQLRVRAIPVGSRRERLYGAALSLVPGAQRPGRPRLSTSLEFKRRRAGLLLRTSYTILRTQGSRQLARHVRRYLKRRLTGERPNDVPVVMDGAAAPRPGPLRQRVAIVIPTHRQTRLVADCVKSIRACLSPPSSELVRIIVVDDGSGDEVCTFLKQLPVEVKCFDRNQGFAKAVNAGIEMADPDEDVVLLNNDTLAHAGWIEALQQCAYNSDRIGVVGAKLLYPDGRIQSAGSYRSVGAPEWFDHCFRFQPGDHLPANIQREVLAVTGACMYIKRAVLTQIGPLNPAFAMAFEDVDYCLRAREAGYQIVYCPAATVTHLEGYTRGERKEAREVRSQEYFWSTWRAHFDGRRFKNSRDRLRVIYVLQDTGIAGGHKVVFEHLNGLAERGYEAELYSLAHAPKWFRLNVPVRTFPDYPALLAALSDQDAIKVATWWETGEVVWKSALNRGAAAFLVQDIETSYYRPEEVRERARVIASYRKEFHYVTDASWTKQKLAEHGVDACVVSPGIDLSIFKPLGLERSRDVVLSVGRSHPLKNVDFLLRAFPRLRARASLHLFGIEPSIGKGLTSRYDVRPSEQEIAELYNRATVFVLTSRHEGYALPVLEAMACGCPVICTNANGNMDFCRDGENCLLVPHDDDARLAEALDLLLGNPELQERLRVAGLATARQYTWPRAIDVLDDFYQRVARERSRYATTGRADSAIGAIAVSK